MDISIRPMTKNDLSEILAIENNSFPDPWSEKLFLDELELNFSHSRVALLGNKLCGYIVLWHMREEGNIMNLAVSPEYRRQGIGKKLLEHMIDSARNMEIRSIFLEVRSRNNAAIKLYESFGFKTYNVRKDYYPDDDAFLMSRDL